jgi:glutamate N-acetyltransferase/amino-acid N-acetyltransferase
MKWLKTGITSPKGFLAAGIYSGIKKKKTEDLTLVYSEVPCRAAGVFTQNKLTAWPLDWSRKVIQAPYHHAILGSSGNANCFNGPTGDQAVKTAVQRLSKIFDIPEASVLLAQTGVIGRPFPVSIFEKGIETAAKKIGPKGKGAARGIMTTDTYPKEFAVSFRLRGKEVRAASIAKGSGTIHPNMATMLVFITTDLDIEKKLLQVLLRKAVQATFNRMSVDNDMSTNDCVFILANGLAGNKRITKECEARPFYEALLALCNRQRFEIVRDGEGVTKVCTIEIQNAKTEPEADRAARQIANSMLFKTMLAGADPNWGRVASALGGSGIPVDFKKITIAFNGLPVLKGGTPNVKALPRLRKILKQPVFKLSVDLKRGKAQADIMTSDLTKEYVAINSEYST